MNINKENYEIYFLDYFEKRLAAEQVAELMVFLEENPKLKDEFDSFELVHLKPEEKINSELFTKLKKPEYKATGSIDAWNYEEKMVAYLEGDIDDNKKAEVQQFINTNPNARLELNLFRKTILVAGEEVYPNKSELKKGVLILLLNSPVFYAVSAAAALIILFGLYSILRQDPRIESPIQMTDIQMPVKNQVKIPVNQQSPDQLAQREEFDASPLFIQNGGSYQSIAHVAQIQSLKRIDFSNVIIGPTSNPQMQNTIESVYASASIDVTDFDLANIDEDKPSFAARFFSGLAKKVVGDPNPDKKSILELSVDGYNMIADREVEVEKQVDSQGKVVAYNINGETVAITRWFNKPNTE